MSSQRRVGPFVSLDHIVSLLDRTLLFIPGAALLTGYSIYKSRGFYKNISIHQILQHLYQHRALAGLLGFVAVRAVNNALGRLVVNHGWRRDRPVWSFGKERGDIVVITGGATGIGKQVVKLLAEKTDKVAVLDIASPLEPVDSVKYYKCDVTDTAAIANAAEQIRAEMSFSTLRSNGHPTVILNLAGVVRGSTLLETTSQQLELTLKIIIVGAHNIIREFLPHLVSINHGHVMTMSSSGAYLSVPQLGAYAASKAGVLAYHEVLVEELAHRYNASNVRTSVICPLKVATDFGDLLNDAPVQFLMPTLSAKAVAQGIVGIIEGGLSQQWTPPFFAGFALPAVRAMPLWMKWILVNSGGATEFVNKSSAEEHVKSYKLIHELDAAHQVQ